jgi:hypothetical protein
MATNLFDDFDPVSSKQWKQKSSLNLRSRLQRNLNLEFARGH